MAIIVVGSWELLLEYLRHDAVRLHVATDLSRNFFENLLVEIATGHALVELDKLNNVTRDGLALRVAKADLIAVKRLHHAEVGLADANNNDRARELGQLKDGVLCCSHIVNCSICEQEQDRVRGLSLMTAHLIKVLVE